MTAMGHGGGSLIADAYPLTPMQQGMLFHHLLEPESRAYRQQLRVRLTGPLDEALVQRCWQDLLARHEVLRSAFIWEGVAEPMQAVLRHAEVALTRHDLSGLDTAARQAEAAAILEADMAQGFRLEQAPLMRLLLLKLAPDLHELVWSHHHILLDGWSTGLVMADFQKLYAAYSEGADPALPPAPPPFREFVALARKSGDGPAAEAFWKTALAGFSDPTRLVFDHPADADAAPDFATLTLTLPAALTKRAAAFARARGLAMNTLLAGVYGIVLARLNGSEDVCFGVTVSGRPAGLADAEAMVGLFINTIPLRLSVPADQAAGTWLAGVQQRLADARDYEHSPLVRIQDWGGMGRGIPLFETIFVNENYPLAASDRPFGELSVAGAEIVESSNYPLAMVTEAVGDSLVLRAIHDCRRLDGDMVERLLRTYAAVLAGVVGDCALPVSRLPLLDANERRRILHDWNDTRRDYDRTARIEHLFERQARRAPDAVAVRDDRRTLTYGEVDAQANRLARLFAARGLKPGTMVAVCMTRRAEMVPVLLGILKAGLAYVPLEPDFPQARIDYALDSLAVACIVTESALADRLAASAAPSLATVVCVDETAPRTVGGRAVLGRAEWMALPSDPVAAAGSAEDLAYVIFTSGSTGTPKGVMVRHRPVVNLIEWVNGGFAIGPADQVLFVTSLCFDLSVYDIFGLLAAGGSIRVAHDHHLKDAERLAALLMDEPVTFWDSAPAMLWQLDPLLPRAAVAGAALRLVFVSGDWVPVALPDRIRTVFPAAQVVALGGATEATVWSNYFPIGEVDPAWPSIPYGRPIQNAAYYILDGNLEPLPPGVPGDLYIGGECLADGYAAAPELTASKFIPDPFSATPGARMYRTGDRARFGGDGVMEFLGRADRQVKVRGFRIELGEIEAVIQRFDGVRDAAVIVHEIAGDRQLAAYVTGAGITPDAVKAHCAAILPRYMVPAFVRRLDAMPLTANGKVELKALPRPDVSEAGQARQAGHADQLAEVVAQCWAGVLERDRVGPDDNFFDLGGHSLKATVAIARLREALGKDIPLRTLFEYPDPISFAQAVRALDGCEMAAIPRRSASAPLPLSQAQRRLWFVCQLEPDSPFYNVVLAARITGKLDRDALERALNAIIARHEVLRTRIVVEGGEPRAVLDEESNVPVAMLDLEGRPDDARAVIEAEARRPFDLAADRLVRLLLVRLADDEHLIALTCHHIVTDGWSMGVLLRELQACWAAGGTAEALPPLPIQYGDFAAWQNAWLASGELDRQRDWWLSHLAGAPTLTLPTDNPAARTHEGKVKHLALGADLARSVRNLARAEGATVFMLLQAAFSALLHHKSGQTDIVTGTDTANRMRPEIEGLIGFFINQLVVRLDLSGDPSFAALMGRARKTLLAAYGHQDLPFDQLVAAINPPRLPGRMPIFQVKLVFQNAPVPPIGVPGLAIEPLLVDTGTAKYDLLLTFEDTPDLTGRCEYNTGLFSAAAIDDLLDRFAALLRLACANPAVTLSELCRHLTAGEAERTGQVHRELRNTGLAKLRALRNPGIKG